MKPELDIKELLEENTRLTNLAERDWLTGLYNHRAGEEKVRSLLEKMNSGVLIIADADHFKMINDTYGHQAGDVALRKIADVLVHSFHEEDVISRIGGDEFMIFIAYQCSETMIEQKIKRINEMLMQMHPDESFPATTVTFGYAVAKDDISFELLFKKADYQLLQKKKERQPETDDYEYTHTEISNMSADIMQICSDLRENGAVAGAFCQSYHAFKMIYRLTERRMNRYGEKATLVLFTLSGNGGLNPSPSLLDMAMEYLSASIRVSVRIGDVYTRFSCCQYLLMIAETDEQEAEQIVERIKSRNKVIVERDSEEMTVVLTHHISLMIPAEN